MVKTVRKVWPEVPTVVGGHYATFAYESLLSTGQISAVCLGESWISFPVLANKITNRQAFFPFGESHLRAEMAA